MNHMRLGLSFFFLFSFFFPGGVGCNLEIACLNLMKFQWRTNKREREKRAGAEVDDGRFLLFLYFAIFGFFF